MADRRGHERRIRRIAMGIAVLAVSVLFAGCAVDSDGVIHSLSPDEVPGGETAPVGSDPGECADLLDRLRESAVDLVGPQGFIGLEQNSFQNGFGGPVFVGRGVFFEDMGIAPAPSSAISGRSSVVVDGRLVVERGGRLYVVGEDGAGVGSVWLDALPEQRWPTPSTLLYGRADDVVAVSPAVPRVDENGDRFIATVVQRVSLEDPRTPVVMERLTVRGEVAGGEITDGRVRLAVSIPAPQLDFLVAITEGGEAAATEHNQALLAETELSDWLGGYELAAPGPDGSTETTRGLLGGCDAVAPPGAEAALGATALLDLPSSGPLTDLTSTTVLGQGQVTYDGDRVYVLSPRSHAVGFSAPGSRGAPRVVMSRIIDDVEGPRIDATGIIAGSLAQLAPVPIGDDGLIVFTTTIGEFGQGFVRANTFELEDDVLAMADGVDLPVDQWDLLRAQPVGDRLLISGNQRGALLDLADLSDLEVTPIEGVWDRGNFTGPPQLAPFDDDAALRVRSGPVNEQFGGIDNFLQSLGFGEFGFGWEPWLEQQGPASIEIVEGDPLEGEAIATFETRAFALWPLSSSSDDGRILAGVLGMVDDDGELFDGVLVLTLDDGALVASARWSFEAPPGENFGASECTRIDIDGLLSDILGLWNQAVLSCEPGEAGGMVGHNCVGMQVPDISAEEIQAWWGQTNPEVEADVAELQQAAKDGVSLQSCTPRQQGDPNVAQAVHADAAGSWIVSPTSVHRLDPSGQVRDSVALEPPYEL